MRVRNLLVGGLVAASLAAGAVGISMTAASAALPTPTEGNITALAAGVRVVASPGKAIAAGGTDTVKLAGQSFGTAPGPVQAIPANATGVVLSVANNQSSGAGQLRVWTTGAGMPGNPTLEWATGKVDTSVVFVALGDNGEINVNATVATRYLIAITGFITPEQAPAAPVVKQIAPVARKAIDVGGSIRTRSTLMGSVTLEPGTWDARVMGSFTGFNSTNNTVAADVQLTGTMVIADGAGATWEFPAVGTAGGAIIPDAQSATLTQDPTVALSQFITVTGSAKTFSVRMFGYASDSSQAGSGELKAGLDSAIFRSVA